MRLVTWALVAVALAYAAYAGFLAIRTYWDVSRAVDHALRETAAAGAGELRRAVLDEVGRSGVPIDDRQVVVREEGGSLRVRVKWAQPLVVVRGDEIVTIPLTVERERRSP